MKRTVAASWDFVALIAPVGIQAGLKLHLIAELVLYAARNEIVNVQLPAVLRFPAWEWLFPGEFLGFHCDMMQRSQLKKYSILLIFNALANLKVLFGPPAVHNYEQK